MKFKDIQTGEIFTINNSPTYPKFKIDGGYIDIRDRIKKMGGCSFPVRLMTNDEIKIAFSGNSKKEVKRFLKNTYNL